MVLLLKEYRDRKICFLCDAFLSGGHRWLSSADLRKIRDHSCGDDPALPASTVHALASEEIDTEHAGVPVCWAKCGATTRYLIARAHRRLDAAAAAGAGASDSGRGAAENSDDVPLTDAPFDLGYLRYDPALYERDLEAKRARVVAELGACGVALPPVETFESPRKHFRQRCRLALHVDMHVPADRVSVLSSESSSAGDSVDAGANAGANAGASVGKLTYLMWDREGIPCRRVMQFPVASKLINDLLQPLQQQLEESEVLLRGLCCVYFLSTQPGDALVVLLYNKEKDLATHENNWRDAAAKAIQSLQTVGVVPGLRALSFIATSKGVRLVQPVGSTYVEETLSVAIPATLEGGLPGESRTLRYRQPFDGFSNPNAAVNQKCLGWLSSVCAELKPTKDLLELYCGAANHTCCLAAYFPRVVAVELNKSLCKAAEVNLSLNGVRNVYVMATHSETFARTIMQRKCSFEDRRQQPYVTYQFGTVLVDPPRSGLDADTRKLLRGFEQIIYISCCPASLVRDLNLMCYEEETDAEAEAATAARGAERRARFAVRRFAVFDHFAYSREHLESAVLLVRISSEAQCI